MLPIVSVNCPIGMVSDDMILSSGKVMANAGLSVSPDPTIGTLICPVLATLSTLFCPKQTDIRANVDTVKRKEKRLNKFLL